ncbi:MAG TPA: hypothetical protein VFM29_09995 [Vicinamibacteria bacterium]|nr:hypothetical protein [Vicinamibacteria bacterium]
MAGKWIATTALILVGASPAIAPRLGVSLPPDLPALDDYERITGELEVASPHTLVQYEFFVNPRRQALYEVVRYRVTPLGTAANGPRVTEKLQWDRGPRDLRRYECVPALADRPATAAARRAATRDGCTWQEMPKDSSGYFEQTATLMWLYGLHRRVVMEREGARR